MDSNVNLKCTSLKNCNDCPLRSYCTRAKEGNHRRLFINEKWEKQKEYIREKLSEKEAGEIYKQRKIDVEPVFGFLKANLSFSRFSVRGKSKVENEIGFALMAVNIRKYAIKINNKYRNKVSDQKKYGLNPYKTGKFSPFIHFRLVLSQPLLLFYKYFSNQRQICFSRSMRIFGSPLRLNSWFAFGNLTNSTSFCKFFSVINSCSACSIGQRKSSSPCKMSNGVSTFFAYFNGEKSQSFAGSSNKSMPSSHFVKK